MSSVANPHSNCRAEIGVKTVKRLLTDNTDHHGHLDTDRFQRAMLQYRNTPDPATRLSPAMCIFGRPIRDFIPIHPGRYEPHPTWRSTLAAREEALRNRHMLTAERLSEHTRNLPPLVIGDYVRIQNQTGPHPTKWDKTGIVIEVRQFDQYVVRVDGSGRVTLRNRRFLRKYTPFIERAQLTQSPYVPPLSSSTHPPLIMKPMPLVKPTDLYSPGTKTVTPTSSNTEPDTPNSPALSDPPLDTSAPPERPASPPGRPASPSDSPVPDSHASPPTRQRRPPAWIRDGDFVL